MKYQDIQAMSIEELQSELADAAEVLTRLNLDHAVKGLENPLEIRNVRKAISQLKTEVRSRQIQEGGEELQKKRTKIRLRRKLNK